MLKKLNCSGVDFPVTSKDYSKIEVLNKICINVFGYEKVVYPVYLSNQCLNDCLDLLLISNDFISYYVYIKDSNRLMFIKTKHKGKIYGENVLSGHKKDYLLINGGKNVKLEKGFIELKKIQ